eukprot:SAG31_NODE_690_length_12796_cov_4.634559_5_plen_165_part_00
MRKRGPETDTVSTVGVAESASFCHFNHTRAPLFNLHQTFSYRINWLQTMKTPTKTESPRQRNGCNARKRRQNCQLFALLINRCACVMLARLSVRWKTHDLFLLNHAIKQPLLRCDVNLAEFVDHPPDHALKLNGVAHFSGVGDVVSTNCTKQKRPNTKKKTSED